jgi:hypothetical protein
MANNISKEKHSQYGKRLLENLLMEKYQCWIIFSKEGEQRRIHAIGITMIVTNHSLVEDELHILSIYGYRTLTDELAEESFAQLRQYAKTNACCCIRMETNAKRIKALAERVGLEPVSVNYHTKL